MVGIGYDSHRFVAGRPLILGGVEIQHERGLDGHSDADVLTHAVIDAILGAAGGGDIGTHLPADDERWRDADSIDLLRTVVGTIAGAIVNVDATVICEEPRIGPYKAEMERMLGEATSARVSVKATRNEGMGWIGRGEGIACIAVASVPERIVFTIAMADTQRQSLRASGIGLRHCVRGEGAARGRGRRPMRPDKAVEGRLHLPALGRLAGDRHRHRGDPPPARDRDRSTSAARSASSACTAAPTPSPTPSRRWGSATATGSGSCAATTAASSRRPWPPPSSAPARST